jgi:dihydropteroate synthase
MERLTVARSPAPPRGFDAFERLYLRPVALLRGDAARGAVESGAALPLAGGGVAFAALEAVLRSGDAASAAWLPVAALDDWLGTLDGEAEGRVRTLLNRLTAPRPSFAGLDLCRPAIMGVVNVTPDSFSDGGLYATPESAIDHGLALAEAGAAIVDVGGESTRPGAEPVPEEEERARVLPVVRALAEAGVTVSVDSRNPATFAAAAEAGAAVINDVTALTHHPDSPAAAAATGLAVVLMHSAGEPRLMQHEPVYDHAALDVYDALAARIAAAEAAGIARARIAVDPGIGFGKTPAHNLRLIGWLAMLHGLGCPVVVGVSRKSTIARVAGGMAENPQARLPGSLALGHAALDQGAKVLRVHDVAETAQALALWQALGED